MLEKTSLGRIRSVLYVLYVLKPAKRADFSMIGRFVNFLMHARACPLLYHPKIVNLAVLPRGGIWNVQA